MYLFTEFDDPHAFFFWDGTDLLFILSHDFIPLVYLILHLAIFLPLLCFSKDVCFLFSQIDVNIHNMTIQIPINQLASCLCSCNCECLNVTPSPPSSFPDQPVAQTFHLPSSFSCVAFHTVSFPRMFAILNLSSRVSQTDTIHISSSLPRSI